MKLIYSKLQSRPPFPRLTNRIRLITVFVITIATLQLLYVQQDLVTLPEQMRSAQVSGGVRIAQSIYSVVLLSVCLNLWVWVSCCYLSPLFLKTICNLFTIHENKLSSLIIVSSSSIINFFWSNIEIWKVMFELFSIYCSQHRLLKRQFCFLTRSFSFPKSVTQSIPSSFP